MNSLATDIKQLIARRLDTASASDVLAIASQLCASNEPRIEPRPEAPPVRFTNLGADGRPTNGSDWVAVYDSHTWLTWTRRVLDCGAKPWKEALEAASAVRLFGYSDWRAPTIQEQLSIVDYERCDPALDTAHFDGDYGWCWTSTPAKSPAGDAWYVGLRNGLSGRYGQSVDFHVRAVRSGQLLDLGF